MGCYSSKAAIPENPVADGQVGNRAVTSRLGHAITLMDGTEEAKQAIELQLAGQQHTIHLGKDQLNVAVPSGTPVTVAAGQSDDHDRQGRRHERRAPQHHDQGRLASSSSRRRR